MTNAERLPISESTHLASWLGRVQSGSPQVVLLTGALGSGKSTVLSVAAREAEARSFQVGEVAFPGPRIVVEHGTTEDPRPQVIASGLNAIADLLRSARLASDRWFLTLDEAHEHDPEQLAGLVRLLANPRSAASLLLMASTPVSGLDRGREAQIVARLATSPITLVHRMQPWTGFDVHNLLLSRRSDVTPSLRFGFDLAAIAGGNPAIIRAYTEMVAALPRDEQLTIASAARGLEDLDPPALAIRMMAALTSELPPDAQRVLQTLAVWGMPSDVDTAATLSGMERPRVEEALDLLEDAGLIEVERGPGEGRFVLREPANPRAVAFATPSRLARRIHQRASDLLAVDGLSRRYWSRRATHHIGAGALTEVKAQQVLGASGLLIERGQWQSAREFIVPVVGMALDGDTLPPSVLVHAVELLADTYTRSGDTATAAALIEATRLPAQRARPGYLSSLHEIAVGRLGAGRDVASELTFRYVASHPSTAPEQRRQAHSWLIQIDSWNGHPERAIRHAAYAREGTENDPSTASEYWVQESVVSRARGHPTDALRAAREALRLASMARDRGAMAKALVAIGDCWLDSESADKALVWLRGGVRRAENASRPLWAAWVRTHFLGALIEAGEWHEAEMTARRGMSLAASMNFTAHGRTAEASLALVRALRGEPSPEFLRTRISASDIMSPHLFTTVSTALYEQQRLAGLDQHARATIQLTAEELLHLPGTDRLLQIDVLPRLAVAQAEAEDEAGLEETVTYYRTAAANSAFLLPVARLEGLVAQARLALLRGRADNAVALLEQVRGGYERMDYRWRWARSASLIARSYAETGRKARAVEALRSGISALEQLGATVEARRVRAQLQTLGARAPRQERSTAPLTQRQLQIAILAARGLSDKEIARETGTSWRTTTTHIHAILKRLGLRSRFEISDWLTKNHAIA